MAQAIKCVLANVPRARQITSSIPYGPPFLPPHLLFFSPLISIYHCWYNLPKVKTRIWPDAVGVAWRKGSRVEPNAVRHVAATKFDVNLGRTCRIPGSMWNCLQGSFLFARTDRRVVQLSNLWIPSKDCKISPLTSGLPLGGLFDRLIAATFRVTRV